MTAQALALITLALRARGAGLGPLLALLLLATLCLAAQLWRARLGLARTAAYALGAALTLAVLTGGVRPGSGLGLLGHLALLAVLVQDLAPVARRARRATGRCFARTIPALGPARVRAVQPAHW